MKFKDKYTVAKEFETLFAFSSEKEEISHEAVMIMFRFFHELQKVKGPLKKKELAQKMGTSASYVTQLFRGDKLINLQMIAKLEKAFGIKFNVNADKTVFSYETNQVNIDLNYDLYSFKNREARVIPMCAEALPSYGYEFGSVDFEQDLKYGG